MNTLKYFVILIVILLAAGCQKEDINPVAPPEIIPLNEQLDNRSAELFNAGVPAVQAADSLTAEFEFDNIEILKSLYQAGYTESDISEIVHLFFGYDPRSAEQVLLSVLSDETKAQIAELILKEYVPELKLNREDLKYFIALIPVIEKQINILKDLYENPPDRIAALLNELKENIYTVIQILREKFALDEAAVKEIMKNTGLSAEQIAGILKGLFNYTKSEVHQYLQNSGFTLIEILNALRTAFHLTIEQLSQYLDEDLNYGEQDRLSILRELQYSYKQIAVLLTGYYKYTVVEVVSRLKDIDASAAEAGQILRDLFNLTAPEITDLLKDLYNLANGDVASLLKELQFNLEEIFAVLNDHLFVEEDEIISILTSLDFDYCDILNLLRIPCW